MFAPDEITQTTEELEVLPRILPRRSAHSAHTGRHQRINTEKQTDALPPLTLETPNAKVAWRQVTQLRKENRHLHATLEGQRAELQKVVSEYEQLQAGYNNEIAIIHQGHQQDILYYQTQLQELMYDRNQIAQNLQNLEEHYQQLQDLFGSTVQAEANRLVEEGIELALQSPESVSLQVQTAVKTIAAHLRKEEDKHLIEALYLKREVQRMADLLQQERQQLQQEQQQLLQFQVSLREQADARKKILEERHKIRGRVVSIFTSFALLASFIILEFVCLALFHVQVVGSIALSIILPIVACILLQIILATPLPMLKTIYTGAPHKRRVKR